MMTKLYNLFYVFGALEKCGNACRKCLLAQALKTNLQRLSGENSLAYLVMMPVTNNKRFVILTYDGKVI